MYMVGGMPEFLRYCRERHNVKMKMQESVIKGATQSEALRSSSVFLQRLFLYGLVLTKDMIARQYAPLVK